jgi:hypothetical protein
VLPLCNASNDDNNLKMKGFSFTLTYRTCSMPGRIQLLSDPPSMASAAVQSRDRGGPGVVHTTPQFIVKHDF